MTVELFRDRLGRSQVHPNDRRWMPAWLAEYANQQPNGRDRLEVSDERVLCFLRSLRDRGVPAWQRLQAARAIDWYQGIVLQQASVDFSPYIVKLGELAAIDRRIGAVGSDDGIAGEGLPGRLDPDEPLAVQELRTRMRVLHHPKSTEDCYARWLLRFIRHLDDEQLEKHGEREIGQFLTDLAVTGEVTAGTQNQALSALIFFYGKVLGKDLRFIQRIRAKASEYLPVVLSKLEVMELLGWMRGESATMFQLMYGSGLRHRECRCLRIKDVCFDMGQIVVRNGKGQKDRITVLPGFTQDSLRRCIETAAAIHRNDLQDGFGSVYLPFALHRKYPNANRELGWQYVFPSHRLSADPRSGVSRRHHVHERTFANAMKKALARTTITKPATPHTLRHSFATHMLEDGG